MEYFTAVCNTERINSYALASCSIIFPKFLELWSHDNSGGKLCTDPPDKLSETFGLRVEVLHLKHFPPMCKLLLHWRMEMEVLPLPYAQVSCVGKHCLFHAKAMLFAIFFASSLEHFKRTREELERKQSLMLWLMKQNKQTKTNQKRKQKTPKQPTTTKKTKQQRKNQNKNTKKLPKHQTKRKKNPSQTTTTTTKSWLDSQIFLPPKNAVTFCFPSKGPRWDQKNNLPTLLLVHVINLTQGMLLIDTSFSAFQCY